MEKNKHTRAERMVTIATVRDPAEARRLKSELEAAGLGCELCAEAASADSWLKASPAGIKVQVGGSQARRAIALLKGLGKSEPATGAKGAIARPSVRFTLPGAPWLRIALGMLALIAAASFLSVMFF